MFNIVRRGSQTPAEPLPRLSEWDPVQLMENFWRWDPFADYAPVRRMTNEQTFAPRFDVKESKDGYLFTADLPGIEEKDIEISLTGNRLCISGQRSQEEKKEGENYYMLERSYGGFCRTFTLPDGADTEKITASMKDGVLTLNVPKHLESKPRRVALSKGAEKTPATTTEKKAQA